MREINLKTFINAPAQQCFDLARNIEFHQLSTQKTKEVAVGGKTEGWADLHDEITWEADHFMIRQQLSVKITAFEAPFFFEDQMTKGAFKSMRHEHHFVMVGEEQTEMEDRFYYEVPFGFIGKIFDMLILKKHMQKLLEERNRMLKEIAENGSAVG
ncbi:SRPBCC family protein [Chryseobacterium sp.]|uniref:SRPBCC family protein n=1 Tax=Chryseobacterium sp. TaxID=1871047 RepID=UPI0011CCC812|nr:SRPBCC family protein [Chryseobacterium sp.]TXF79461.1 SRPBCC family protein [Chryseobacterium sp.]